MGASASLAFSPAIPAWAHATAPAGAIVHQEAAAAAISARARGAATALVGISWIEDFQAIVVRQGAGLRGSRDLRDTRIGLPAATVQNGSPRVHALRGATVALESEGLFHRHVQWVDLPAAEAVSLTLPTAYSAEIAALQEGSVDAVYVRGPAGLEAARAAGARLLFNIGAHRDAWIRNHSALLQAVTVSETLLRAHPEVVAQTLLERWPLLPARMSLDEAAVKALETLKSFMLRWVFIQADFPLERWLDARPATRPAASDSSLVVSVVRHHPATAQVGHQRDGGGLL
jgi:ABC-type nitrate/sulfonate/bicarbonate transport system substrate-binding protein